MSLCCLLHFLSFLCLSLSFFIYFFPFSVLIYATSLLLATLTTSFLIIGWLSSSWFSYFYHYFADLYNFHLYIFLFLCNTLLLSPSSWFLCISTLTFPVVTFTTSFPLALYILPLGFPWLPLLQPSSCIQIVSSRRVSNQHELLASLASRNVIPSITSLPLFLFILSISCFLPYFFFSIPLPPFLSSFRLFTFIPIMAFTRYLSASCFGNFLFFKFYRNSLHQLSFLLFLISFFFPSCKSASFSSFFIMCFHVPDSIL